MDATPSASALPGSAKSRPRLGAAVRRVALAERGAIEAAGNDGHGGSGRPGVPEAAAAPHETVDVTPESGTARPQWAARPLFRIVENDAERKAFTGDDGTHSMAVVGSIKTPIAPRWAVRRRDDDRLALLEANHASDGLGPGLLFHQEQLAAGEFGFGLAEAADHLEREKDSPVDILVKRIVVAFALAEQQRSRRCWPPEWHKPRNRTS